MDKTFRIVLLIFIFLGGLLVTVTALSLHNLNRAIRAANWVDHTRATLAEIDSLVATLQTADGAVRAYLITNSEADRATYRTAFNELGERVEVARALIASAPAEIAAFEELETQLVARADFARRLLTAKQSGESLERLLIDDDGGTTMFEIRRQAQQIRNHFTAELNQHDQEVFAQDEIAKNSLWGLASLILLSLLGSAWFIRDALQQRRAATLILERSNVELESQVVARTQDLLVANRNLKTENLDHRWRAEALDHQQRYNQRIIDSISDLVLVITKIGNISRINPAVVRHTGFDAPKLVNNPLTDFISIASPGQPGAADGFDPIADALRGGHTLRDLPVKINTCRQTQVSAFLGFFPLTDNDQIIGAVVTLRLVS